MRGIFKFFVFVWLLISSTYAIAGKDPISWALNRPFHNPAIVGRTYSVIYTFTNQLPVKLVKPIVIDKQATPANDFSYVDLCTGKRLNPRESCTVTINFTPESAGNKSVQLIITGYDDNRVPVPVLTMTAQGTSISAAPIYASVTQSMPANLSIGQSYSYGFSFTNRSNATVSGTTLSVSQTSGTASYTTSNCSSSLGAGQTCYVTGGYTPTSSTPVGQTVTAAMTYSGNNIASASTSGSVTSSSGVIPSFVVPYYLPAEMEGGASNQKLIEVQFFNNTGSTITVQSRDLAITTGGGSGTFTINTSSATDNCMLSAGVGSKPLLNGQACIITGTFEGNVVGVDTQVVITGEITYTGATGSPSSIATSTYLVPTLGTSRTINLVNDCDFPIWFSLHGGALGSSPSCPTTACPAGTSCNTSNNTCYWNNIGPDVGTSFQLAASGGTNSVTIPLNSGTDPAIQWSGVISASLRCDNGASSCMVAPCGNSDGSTACAVGQGFVGPATQAEFTFNISTSDSYDIEVINGFHIPVAITPNSHTTPDNYTCGVAGNFTAANNFGSCNWNTAAPPGNGYYMVTGGGNSCNINSPSCATNEICGLSVNFDTNTLTQSCGAFLGYWTANQVCGMNPTPGSAIDTYFQCSTPLGGPFPSGSTNYDLMKCSVPKGDTAPPFNSCYLTYSADQQSLIPQCCGCQDWWTLGIGANPNTQSCTQPNGTLNTDPTWNSNIQNGVEWLKRACPSSYVYPFDDKSSGFSCSNNLPGDANSADYTITFCQGTTGKPAGKLDGRKNPPSFRRG